MLQYSKCLVNFRDPISRPKAVYAFIIVSFGPSTHSNGRDSDSLLFLTGFFLFWKSEVGASQHQWALLQSTLLLVMIHYFLLNFLCTHALHLRLSLVNNNWRMKRRPSLILTLFDASLLRGTLHWLYHLLGRWIVVNHLDLSS